MPDITQLLALVVINILMAWAIWFPIAAGQYSMATPGVIAIGAYGAAVALQHGFGLIASLAVGAAGGLIASVPLALITYRLTEFRFAIVTLGLAEVVRISINNIPELGGPMGIFGLPTSPYAVWAGLILVVAVAALSWRFARSSGWRIVELVRDDEIQARTLGIDPAKAKWLTLCCGGIVGGLAGALQTNYTGLAEPNSFGFALSVQLFAFAVLGGTTTFWGPILGATFLTVCLDFLSFLDRLSYVVFGLLLIIVMRWRPDGLLTQNREWRRARQRRLAQPNG